MRASPQRGKPAPADLAPRDKFRCRIKSSARRSNHTVDPAAHALEQRLCFAVAELLVDHVVRPTTAATDGQRGWEQPICWLNRGLQRNRAASDREPCQRGLGEIRLTPVCSVMGSTVRSPVRRRRC
jgi:hypothetical protein